MPTRQKLISFVSAMKRKFGVLKSLGLVLVGILIIGGSVLTQALIKGVKQPLAPSKLSNYLPTGISASQAGQKARSKLSDRLTLQPEADRLRRRLGNRFIDSELDQSIIAGMLTIKGNLHPIQIIRTQIDDGENITVALDGQTPSLSWNHSEGPHVSGNRATGEQKLLIERIVLDSPDQFILAQLRGANYYTVARQVRPSEAGSSISYQGPVWDLVRLAEPMNNDQDKPDSPWRLFYLNTTSGLIDKIVSGEDGETVVAELFNWKKVGNELVPMQIKWARKGNPIMELNVNSVNFGTRK